MRKNLECTKFASKNYKSGFDVCVTELRLILTTQVNPSDIFSFVKGKWKLIFVRKGTEKKKDKINHFVLRKQLS